MKELEDKATAEEKAAVETARENLQKAVDANDVEDMKAKIEELTNAFYPISTRIYQEAQQAQAQTGAAGTDMGAAGPDMGSTAGGSDAFEADYEVVDEDK